MQYLDSTNCMCLPLQREKISKSSIIELTDLDRGESYCFNVQAFLPFRAQDKQHGEISNIQCSPEQNTSLFEGNAWSFYINTCPVRDFQLNIPRKSKHWESCLIGSESSSQNRLSPFIWIVTHPFMKCQIADIVSYQRFIWTLWMCVSQRHLMQPIALLIDKKIVQWVDFKWIVSVSKDQQNCKISAVSIKLIESRVKWP